METIIMENQMEKKMENEMETGTIIKQRLECPLSSMEEGSGYLSMGIEWDAEVFLVSMLVGRFSWC